MNIHPRKNLFHYTGGLALWNVMLGVVLALTSIVLGALQAHGMHMHEYLNAAPFPLGMYGALVIIDGAFRLFNRADIAQRVSPILFICFLASLGYTLLVLRMHFAVKDPLVSLIWNYP